MLIKDILLRDPATHPLANNGQARINDVSADGRAEAELRSELATFVCEGQFADGMQRILGAYLGDLGHSRQRAAWVSGFFGSGKSHFLKMLCHLWRDTRFGDGATARGLVPALPGEIQAQLRELDGAGRRGGGLFAAAGTLPSGTADNVRLTVLAILLRAAGLPEPYPQAAFCLWLEESGWLEAVQKAVEESGKAWRAELNNLYVSPHLARAVLRCDANFAASEVEARQTLRSQFPPVARDLTTAQFIEQCRRVLRRAGGGKLPATVLILDEVEQFIAQSEIVSALMTEVAEAVETQLDSAVMLVGAGQSALAKTTLLTKMLDRFPIAIQLSDTDVETVTRKVLLQKRAGTQAAMTGMLEQQAGEIARQLAGTKIGPRGADREVLGMDYPLLPVRRRFWEQCFRQVDSGGKESQLRSQLRIIHDALRKVAGQELGAVIPASELYEALAPGLVTAGTLPRQIADKIIRLGGEGGESSGEAGLRQRICGLVFLIGELKQVAGTLTDLGIQASAGHIADLLVEDLGADNGLLRERVTRALEGLAEQGTLMRLGGEYRIQTEEGRVWEQDFRGREVKLGGDLANLDEQREGLLVAEVERLLGGTRLLQGAAKVPRKFALSRGTTPPGGDGEAIPVWLTYQFSQAEHEVRGMARGLGDDSAVVTLYLPRRAPDDLARAIAACQAAEQTLQSRAVEDSEGGRLARRSMESRREQAKRRRDELIEDIVANGVVLQGGGGTPQAITVDERLRTAAEAAMARLFPRFQEADAPAAVWEQVLKQARDGADHPFAALKYDGPTERHAVCRQARATIGGGKSGAQVRQELRASPYGWPQDAIDAGLIALHRGQHVTATLNGVLVAVGQLDQSKIGKSLFRVEGTVLDLTARLAIRGLYLAAGVSCKSGEEAAKSGEFLRALRVLLDGAGGDAPLPQRPAAEAIARLEGLDGNERLAELRDEATGLGVLIRQCKRAAELKGQRLKEWKLLEGLAGQCAGLSEAQAAKVKPALAEMDAVRAGRMLLEETDPAAAIMTMLASGLREELAGNLMPEAQAAFRACSARLEGDENWRQLGAERRDAILVGVGLRAPETPELGTAEDVFKALAAQSLGARRDAALAMAHKVDAALQQAAELLVPKIQFVAVDRATLKNEAEVKAWAARQEKKLVAALKQGPVQVQ